MVSLLALTISGGSGAPGVARKRSRFHYQQVYFHCKMIKCSMAFLIPISPRYSCRCVLKAWLRPEVVDPIPHTKRIQHGPVFFNFVFINDLRPSQVTVPLSAYRVRNTILTW